MQILQKATDVGTYFYDTCFKFNFEILGCKPGSIFPNPITTFLNCNFLCHFKGCDTPGQYRNVSP